MKLFYRLILKKNLFISSLAFSILLHLLLGTSVLVAYLRNGEYFSSDINSSDINADISDMDVDINEIPPELTGGDKDPKKIEKSEWIEGSSKNAEDAPVKDENINALSGSSEDGDGYLFSVHGDRPPAVVIHFNVNNYYPSEAKSARIKEKTVLITLQIEKNGDLKSAKIVSEPSGYGFDEAALKIIKMARFRPGYIDGKPVKMNHRLAFKFKLE